MTTLVIESLGAGGDGVVRGPKGPVFVPFALPSETVNVALDGPRADLIAVLEPSPLRSAPACRQFGQCGGCAMQHLEEKAYRDWKRAIVVDELARHGMDAPVAALISCPPGTRRRLVLSARVTETGVELGFRRALSHELVDIAECPVAEPRLVAALPALRRIAARIGKSGKPFRLLATATANGLDIAAADSGTLDEAQRRAAIAAAMAEGAARLSLDGVVLVEARPPVIDVDGIALSPPSGGFLQAVAGAEQAMAALALSHLAGAKRVADLFCGSGAFTLRLARHSAVHAVESDAGALAALERARRAASGLKPVTTEKRDLFRRPLLARELAAFDGLVFDPPRAGAEEQARQIARSSVQRIVAVSCNPGTLARDLRILVDGGYRLAGVTPVDQFLWSPHVEAVALLDKPRPRR